MHRGPAAIETKSQGDRPCGCSSLFFCAQASASYCLCVLCVLCGDLVCAAARAADPTLISVGAKPVEAALVGFGADGTVRFRAEATGAEAASPGFSVRIDDLVRWGHPANPRPQTLVLLADGSRLVTAADWSGGSPVQVDAANVVVQSVAWSEARWPRTLVAGIVFSHHERWEDRQRLEDTVRSELGEKDVLLLSNEDRVTGRIVKLAGGSVTIDVEGRETSMPLSRVAAIGLGKVATGGSPSARPQAPQIVVGMRDGSLLNAAKVVGVAENLSLELSGGGKLSGGAVDDVIALVGAGGAKFVYLSDLEPVDYKHVPYLSISWPYRRGRNLLDGPLTADGKRYLKGIAMHSASRLTYRLDGKYQRFDATAALDDSSEGRGSVTFGVYLLRGGAWKQAATSDTVRGGAAPEPVSVDVRGAEMITLTVDYADRGDELDHADWLDARLVKNN